MTPMNRLPPKMSILLIGGCVAAALLSVQGTPQESASPRSVFDRYCVTCHSEKTHTAGIDLETLNVAKLGANPELVEKVIAKLRAASMPPPGMPRPDVETYRNIAALLEREMDHVWAAN